MNIFIFFSQFEPLAPNEEWFGTDSADEKRQETSTTAQDFLHNRGLFDEDAAIPPVEETIQPRPADKASEGQPEVAVEPPGAPPRSRGPSLEDDMNATVSTEAAKRSAEVH